MRLMEFIWSQCKPTGAPYQYDMNDPRDKKLYEISQQNKQSHKEFLASSDELDKSKSPSDTDDELSDNFSTVSQLSQQSLVHFFGKETNSSLVQNEQIETNVSVLESDTEEFDKGDESKTSSVTSSIRCTNCTDVIVNNPSEPKRLKCHVPEFYYGLYYSDDSDDAKVLKLKEQNWITDSLLEEMSHYYPKKEDVTRDPLTNDISMSKDSFSINFRKMFPPERIFINYIQLREAVKNIFQAIELVIKEQF